MKNLSVTERSVTNAKKQFQARDEEWKSKDGSESFFQENHFKRSSKEERREDALAPGAEEGRDKLRKAVGRCK